MRILGIDPGTTAIGYAILETGKRLCVLRADLIDIKGPTSSERLIELRDEVEKIIHTWSPERVAIEKLFLARNQKTAMAVAEARGVILLTTSLAGPRVYEYTPLEVKKIVTGDGNADKLQVKKMLQLTFPELKSLRARDDVFDAIAIALTCHFRERRTI